ncbi:MAG: hypothetical protein ACYT04_41720 [Nostoc sp.]
MIHYRVQKWLEKSHKARSDRPPNSSEEKRAMPAAGGYAIAYKKAQSSHNWAFSSLNQSLSVE